jgi:hypothetical protein
VWIDRVTHTINPHNLHLSLRCRMLQDVQDVREM